MHLIYFCLTFSHLLIIEKWLNQGWKLNYAINKDYFVPLRNRKKKILYLSKFTSYLIFTKFHHDWDLNQKYTLLKFWYFRWDPSIPTGPLLVTLISKKVRVFCEKSIHQLITNHVLPGETKQKSDRIQTFDANWNQVVVNSRPSWIQYDIKRSS